MSFGLGYLMTLSKGLCWSWDCVETQSEDNSGDLYVADPISALFTPNFVFTYANIRMSNGSINSAISVQEYLLLFCWMAFSYVFTNGNSLLVIEVFRSIYLLNKPTRFCRSHWGCTKSRICLYVQCFIRNGFVIYILKGCIKTFA